MDTTYRAIQAIAPGKLLAVELAVAEPPPGYVRIRVEACGICHSDATFAIIELRLVCRKTSGNTRCSYRHFWKQK
jgi:D-arabinose 1-dehydrogenase-like Zn-dependent alcohol dehydrogenase